MFVGEGEGSPSSTVSNFGASPLAPRGILLLAAAAVRPGEELLLLPSVFQAGSWFGFDGSESESDCRGELIELRLEDEAGGGGDFIPRVGIG